MTLLPQPWEHEDAGPVTRSEWMALAEDAESRGMRLAVWTFVDAYPEDCDRDSGWQVASILITDWRTGEVIAAYDPEVEEPVFSNLFDVEHRLAESA